MFFNVAGLLRSEMGATRGFSISGETLHTLDGSIVDINGPVRLLRTDSTILVSAKLTARADAECSRCTEPAGVELSFGIEEEFRSVNTDLRMRRGTREEQAGEDWFTIASDNLLDLSEPIRQAAISAMPIAPICDAACAGLCPKCSANQNSTSCACAERTTDRRWRSLEALLAHGE